jgi:hypothetical protein
MSETDQAGRVDSFGAAVRWVRAERSRNVTRGLHTALSRWGFLDSDADPDLVVERRADLAEAITTVWEADSHQARVTAIDAILQGAQLNTIRENQKTVQKAQAQEPSPITDRG